MYDKAEINKMGRIIVGKQHIANGNKDCSRT